MSAGLQFNVLGLHERDPVTIIKDVVLEQRRVLKFRAVPIVPLAVLIPSIDQRDRDEAAEAWRIL